MGCFPWLGTDAGLGQRSPDIRLELQDGDMKHGYFQSYNTDEIVISCSYVVPKKLDLVLMCN